MCMTNLKLTVSTLGMFLSCTLPPRLSRISVSSMSSMFSYVHTFKLTYRRISVKQLILFTSYIPPMLGSVGEATHQPKSVPSDPSASAQAGQLILYAAGFVPNGALYRFIITSVRRTISLWLIILSPESAPAWLWEEILTKDINGPPSVHSTLRIVGRVREKEGLVQSDMRGLRELWVQPTAQHAQSLHTCVRDEPLAVGNTHTSTEM